MYALYGYLYSYWFKFVLDWSNQHSRLINVRSYCTTCCTNKSLQIPLSVIRVNLLSASALCSGKLHGINKSANCIAIPPQFIQYMYDTYIRTGSTVELLYVLLHYRYTVPVPVRIAITNCTLAYRYRYLYL